MKGAQSLVFVVDDDLSVREALSSLIRSVGLHVETYASASEFLERLRQPVLVPACVVLDVRMPDIDRKSTRLNSSHIPLSRMPSSA